MFDFFTYPNRVTKLLMKRGWTPQTLPPVSNAWLTLLQALRKNGVMPETAAIWLDQALQGDIASLEMVNAKSGIQGMMMFGTPEQWEEYQHKFYRK